MISVERARISDAATIEQLISEYHESEGITPQPERIAWAVALALRAQFPCIILVARDSRGILGVALATYSPSAELGRVLMVNDFYVHLAARRKGIGRLLAEKLVEEAKIMRIDRIDLEVLSSNILAAKFWETMGFRTEGRKIYSLDLEGAPT